MHKDYLEDAFEKQIELIADGLFKPCHDGRLIATEQEMISMKSLLAVLTRAQFASDAPGGGVLPVTEGGCDYWLRTASSNHDKLTAWYAWSERQSGWHMLHPRFPVFASGVIADRRTGLFEDKKLLQAFPPRAMPELSLDPLPHWSPPR